MNAIEVRERYVVGYLLEHPGAIAPEEALAAVVWPSPLFAAITPARTSPSTTRQRNGDCAGCGGPLQNRTRGCKTCTNRHNVRARRRLNAGRLDTCLGCRTPLENRTLGCKTCHERHRSRKRRAA